MDGKNLHGRIVKGIAGFYYVEADGIGMVECHAKGIFRKEQVKPLVGDWVKLELLEQEEKGSIVEIEPRKNRLIRPEVANVDQALVVFAHARPQPNLNLLDKFLIMMSKNDIPCILCFNKEDLVSEEERERICAIYANAGVRVISLQADAFSVIKHGAFDASKSKTQWQKDFGCNQQEPKGKKQETGIPAAAEKIDYLDIYESLKALLDQKLTVLAGPSGVGKSTLVNSICPKAQMETGSISHKLERGKHTTRHSELFEIWEHSYLMDTPGFTAFDLDADIEKEQLKDYYPEFYEYEGKCKFQGCTHTHEPDCAVKAAVMENRIHKIRYEGYVAIFEELKSRKKYDKKNYIKNT